MFVYSCGEYAICQVGEAARAVRAENKRHWKSQAYIKHYPNLGIKEYYGIFRSGLFKQNIKTFPGNRGIHFTVVCLVAKPMHRSEARVDFVVRQTLLFFICRPLCYHANYFRVSIVSRSIRKNSHLTYSKKRRQSVLHWLSENGRSRNRKSGRPNSLDIRKTLLTKLKTVSNISQLF